MPQPNKFKKEKEITDNHVNYTTKQLLNMGYMTFAKFSRRNNIGYDSVKALQARGDIIVVTSLDGKPLVSPDSKIVLSPMEKEILNRNSKLYAFSKREGLKDIRLKRSSIDSAYEEYVYKRAQGEDVEIYYNPKENVLSVAAESEIMDKKHNFCITEGILAVGNVVNSFTIKNEARWISIEFKYNSYKVAYFTEDHEQHKKAFESLGEAKAHIIKEMENNESSISDVVIYHHGYELLRYVDGEFIEINEEKRIAQDKLREGNLKKLMSEIDDMK